MWWIAVAVAADDPCADSAAAAASAAEVQALYDAGEKDRPDRSAAAVSVLERDEERVKAVLKLDEKGALCTGLAKWQAAWLLQQADDPEALDRAVKLASESTKLGEKRGPWLTAVSFDRWRVAGGYRQSYGTMTQVNADNQRCLVEIEADVTDADRATYGIPPLAETYRKILDANGFTTEAATLDRLERHGLYCKPEANTKKARRTVRAPG